MRSFTVPHMGLFLLLMLGIALLLNALRAVTAGPLAQERARFAVIGDYSESQAAEDVATLINSWSPDFIITLGDNNYPEGSATTIDENIGQYYHNYIFPYLGSYGPGASSNQFFPTLGNHDWERPNAQPYRDYFTLPNNERYYDFAQGPVHLFALDTDPREPDGITSTSVQALWLQDQLRTAREPWKLVYGHHAPYSSSSFHGSTPVMQWPYQEWGATGVLSGHDHTYERILRDGIVYFVNGLGGRGLYNFGPPVLGSNLRYSQNYGALFCEADASTLTCQFIARTGLVLDTYTINAASPADLVGHVTWEGRPPQPHVANQIPITLTLHLGSTVMAYPNRQTDQSGVFRVPVTNLAPDVYTWWAKGPQSLASTGTVLLPGGALGLELGVQRTGDANNDNLVDITDFTILRNSFGRACGDSGYDARADFTGDCVVDITDFTLLRTNFGQAGAPRPRAARRPVSGARGSSPLARAPV